MPNEVITSKKPNLSLLPEWGCIVWVHTKDNLKLDAQAIEGCWMGYDEQSKGSRIYWPNRRSVTVERSLTFMKPFVAVDEFEGEDNVQQPRVKSRVKPPSPEQQIEQIISTPPEEPRTPPHTSPGPPLVLYTPCIQ